MSLPPKEECDKTSDDGETGTIFGGEVRGDTGLQRRGLKDALKRVARGMEQGRGPEALRSDSKPRVHEADSDDGKCKTGVRVPERHVRAVQRRDRDVDGIVPRRPD